MAQFFASQKKILEINANHELIRGLLERVNSSSDNNKGTIQSYNVKGIRSNIT